MQRQLQGTRKYRRFLESLTVEAHGEVNAVAAHLIDEATTAEMHAAVCRYLLRTRLTEMKPSDIARCSEQILKSKTIRNKAVERLELVTKPTDPWLVLPAPVVADEPEEESDEQATNAEAG